MRDFYREASYGLARCGRGRSAARAARPRAGIAPRSRSPITPTPTRLRRVSQERPEARRGGDRPRRPECRFLALRQRRRRGSRCPRRLSAPAAVPSRPATSGDIWSHKWSIPPQVARRRHDRPLLHGSRRRPRRRHVPRARAPAHGLAGPVRHRLLVRRHRRLGPDGRRLLERRRRSPAHPTSWCKTRVQWVNPTVSPTSPRPQHPRRMRQRNGVQAAYRGRRRRNTSLSRTASRRASMAPMPAEGLLVRHIDDGKPDNTDENHYIVDSSRPTAPRPRIRPQPRQRRRPLPDHHECQLHGFELAEHQCLQRRGLEHLGDEHRPRRRQHHGRHQGRGAARPPASSGTTTAPWPRSFAYYTTQWAWANISGLGWRRDQRRLRRRGVQHVREPVRGPPRTVCQVHVEADGGLLYTMYLI